MTSWIRVWRVVIVDVTWLCRKARLLLNAVIEEGEGRSIPACRISRLREVCNALVLYVCF